MRWEAESGMLVLLLKYTTSGPITPTGCWLNLQTCPRARGRHIFYPTDRNGHLGLREGG
jgi:formylglycine-generating enzyme required for sulfatase activity